MDLILCHQTADFDALGAAVGLTKLHLGAKIILTGGAHPSVKNFLALHRDELALMEFRSVNPQKIRNLFIVDTQNSSRLGKATEWLDLENIESITIYDHHLENEANITASFKYIEKVGSSATIICELLQEKSLTLNTIEATVMALGIHVDTGSLTYEQTTSRDALALAWLMTQGINLRTIGEYVEPSLAPSLQQLLPQALKNLQTEIINGCCVGWILLETPNFMAGLSNLAGRIRDLTEVDVFLLGHYYGYSVKSKQIFSETEEKKKGKLTVIGRSGIDSVNLASIFTDFGGGGHSSAASFNLRCDNPQEIINNLLTQIKDLIPFPLVARDLMSSPVRTILPHLTIEKAQRILLRYGHSGLFVVTEKGELVGVISRRDIDLALHHGFSHAPVKGYMTKNVQKIHPQTSFRDIQSLMVNNDIGRLPVMENNELLGIVTRTDILRHLHQFSLNDSPSQDTLPLLSCLLPSFEKHLHPPIWKLLQQAATYAQTQGWHLYLVGGGVRDLLLTSSCDTLSLQDIDLVVDGFHKSAITEAGVKLAKSLQNIYPQARLSIHGEFQTAALLWHKDENLGSLWVDIATARTEFYPYPAANPVVESSSIRQDLYRRDFTINALAVRLTHPRGGELLDFFGGLKDLRSNFIRVLHPNSFIEDPTRIFRAVRFAVRLNFIIESETREYINYAISSGVYERVSSEKTSIPALTTRLKAELNYILQAQYWKPALKLLQEVGALTCLHKNCQLTPQLWWQIRCLDRWLRYYHLDEQNPPVTCWLLRLEIILASFMEGVKVAENLQLPKDSIQRLKYLSINEENIKNTLSTCQSISEKVKFLSTYQPLTLLLVAVKNDKHIRKTIWCYLMTWNKIKFPFNGDDLRDLGYKPSKKYKQILTTVQALFLDGKINNTLEAKDFILKNYPLC
ncbi:MAG: CBS domain-containing protein [Cyanobacteria bacterium]|nr:CBS domain-containing protein [Cyanobacteria bacterium CG_2015-16_32_12]NCO77266.1 CBS domain-containing protein [Cyanobacteria bacterium CG_2015-22_32_23]NCQ05429.1 CBS domain-containing protein [Cyanobacteria bacterium CG_2015-09_32_10]NCQ41700.1 CBS domain-containing protein [Cyanobacteria bacterium CG_2015-04_32_10]NCS85090.1 CBS domain-containing protein [Cyanobacteria bacterium CG_2015-02_32_10]